MPPFTRTVATAFFCAAILCVAPVAEAAELCKSMKISPRSTFQEANGKMYLVNSESVYASSETNAVTVMNGKFFQKRIPLPWTPHFVLKHGGNILVMAENGTYAVIDPKTDEIVTTVELSFTQPINYPEIHGETMFLDRQADVAIVDLKTHTVTATLTMPFTQMGVGPIIKSTLFLLSSQGSDPFTLAPGKMVLLTYDLEKKKIVRQQDIPQNIRIFSSINNSIFFIKTDQQGRDTIGVYNMKKGTFGPTTPLTGTFEEYVAAENSLYISTIGNTSGLDIFDSGNGTLKTLVRGGGDASLQQANGRLMATTEPTFGGNATVSIIDTAEKRVTKTIPLNHPSEWQSLINETLLVFGQNKVSIISVDGTVSSSPLNTNVNWGSIRSHGSKIFLENYELSYDLVTKKFSPHKNPTTFARYAEAGDTAYGFMQKDMESRNFEMKIFKVLDIVTGKISDACSNNAPATKTKSTPSIKTTVKQSGGRTGVKPSRR